MTIIKPTKMLRVSLTAYNYLRKLAFERDCKITDVFDQVLGITPETYELLTPLEIEHASIKAKNLPEESKGSIFDKYGNN